MLTLTKEFETGVKKIDDQHRELVNKINAVLGLGMSSVTKEETEKTLNFLEEYILKHFRDEERIQQDCGYPKCEWHKKQHAILTEEIKKYKKEYLANGPSAKYTLELNNSLIQWLVRHIKVADLEIGNYCQASV